MSDVAAERVKHIVVSEASIQRTARGLLGTKLVYPEFTFVLSRLHPKKTTQEELDEEIRAVRKRPWNEIYQPPEH